MRLTLRRRNTIVEERKTFGSTLVTMVTQQGALAISVYVPDMLSYDKRFNCTRRESEQGRTAAQCCPKIYSLNFKYIQSILFFREDTIWSTTSFGNYYSLYIKSFILKDTISWNVKKKVFQLLFHFP